MALDIIQQDLRVLVNGFKDEEYYIKNTNEDTTTIYRYCLIVFFI